MTMINQKHVFFAFCIMLFSAPIIAEPLLMIHLRSTASCQDHQDILKQLKKPGVRDAYRARRLVQRQRTSGIFATYAGYLDISSWDGTLAFPLKHSTPELNIVITNRIVPIPVTSLTLHHWQLKPGIEATLYHLKKQSTGSPGKEIWRVTKKDRPENNEIPLDALVIIAKPENIVVKTDDAPVKPGPHMVVPDIQVRSSINTLGNALYAINLSHFFKPVTFAHKKVPTKLTKQLDLR